MIGEHARLTARSVDTKLLLPARLTSAGSPQQETLVIERTNSTLPIDATWAAAVPAYPRMQVGMDHPGAGTRA